MSRWSDSLLYTKTYNFTHYKIEVLFSVSYLCKEYITYTYTGVSVLITQKSVTDIY